MRRAFLLLLLAAPALAEERANSVTLRRPLAARQLAGRSETHLVLPSVKRGLVWASVTVIAGTVLFFALRLAFWGSLQHLGAVWLPVFCLLVLAGIAAIAGLQARLLRPWLTSARSWVLGTMLGAMLGVVTVQMAGALLASVASGAGISSPTVLDAILWSVGGLVLGAVQWSIAVRPDRGALAWSIAAGAAVFAAMWVGSSVMIRWHRCPRSWRSWSSPGHP